MGATQEETKVKEDPRETEFSVDATDDTDAAAAAVDSQRRELALRDSTVPRLHVGEPAYKQFSKEMLALVAKSIMPEGYTLPELYMGLEVAATYGLDVFTKELWLIRMKDGGPVVPVVGRDGMLAIAERHRDFRGYRNAEVYEHDTFLYHDEPRARPDGTFTHVEHSFQLTKDRGLLLGSYAEVYRAGRPPIFFWAPLNDYYRDSGPWKKQKTAMIRKCALANALRLAYRISGLYVADEMSGAAMTPVEGGGELAAAFEPQDESRWFGEDADVADRLKELFAAVNRLRPQTWTPGKVKLELSQLDAEGREKMIERLETQITDLGGEIPLPSIIGEAVEVEDVDIPFGEDAPAA